MNIHDELIIRSLTAIGKEGAQDNEHFEEIEAAYAWLEKSAPRFVAELDAAIAEVDELFAPFPSVILDAGKTQAPEDFDERAVERICLILKVLQDSVDGVTLSEVAQTVGLRNSSAFRYLRILENHRYVERDEVAGRFWLGLGFVGMQSRYLEILREHARPSLRHLRDEFGETASLGLLGGDHVVYIDIVESRHGVRLAASRGDHEPIHCTALGKAIAAWLPEERVRELLRIKGMPSHARRTITSTDAYFNELAKVRRLGYALDDRESMEDARCVAAPLFGTHLPAAISISGPSVRFPLQKVKKAAKTLIDVAADIARNATGPIRQSRRGADGVAGGDTVFARGLVAGHVGSEDDRVASVCGLGVTE